MLSDLLREFSVLGITGNYTAAARELCISQPTLSRHVDALESELGVKLVFDQQPFCLTQAGKALLRHASAVAEIYREIEVDIAPFRCQTPERIRIENARTQTSYVSVFDRVQNQLDENRTQTTLEYVNVAASLSPEEALEIGVVDIMMVPFISQDAAYTPQPGSGFATKVVPAFRMPAAFVVLRDSPYAVQEGLRLEAFAGARFLTPARKSHERYRQEFCAICQEAGFTPRFEFVNAPTLDDFYTKKLEPDQVTSTPPTPTSPRFTGTGCGTNATRASCRPTAPCIRGWRSCIGRSGAARGFGSSWSWWSVPGPNDKPAPSGTPGTRDRIFGSYKQNA